ncbi:MAG: hypothetical protein R3D29_03875 [Nitratireductor sp.]
MLTGGFSSVDRRARVNAARDDLIARPMGWDAEEALFYASLPYSAYFMATDADTQVRTWSSCDKGDELCQRGAYARQFEAITETRSGPDHPRLRRRSLLARKSCRRQYRRCEDSHDRRWQGADLIFINRIRDRGRRRSAVRGGSEP